MSPDATGRLSGTRVQDSLQIAFAIEAHLDVDATLTIAPLPAGSSGGADTQQQE
jgi:hypothetical protein